MEEMTHGLIKYVWTSCVDNMEDIDGLRETMIFIADQTDQHGISAGTILHRVEDFLEILEEKKVLFKIWIW